MARIEESVEIKRPADKVFAYVTDAKSFPQWDSATLEAEQTSPGQVGVGATLRGAHRVMGRRWVWTAKVTEYEPNKKWGGTISFRSMLIEEHVTFDPVEGGTKVTFVYEMKVGGFLKLLSPIGVSTMRKQTKENLSNLESILEAQA
jgi:uncharacterized protein YndB with AHSA1/START domain